MADSDVIVIDAQRQYVESISTALARIAIRSHRARIYLKSPFTIQLAPGLHRTPRPERRSLSDERGNAVEVVHGKIGAPNMTTRNPVALTKMIEDYFKTNPDEVWVKATTDMQVVLQSRKKGEPLTVPTIQPGDPVLLTRYATVEELRGSDLRHMIMQGKLRLVASEEADQYFAAKAKRMARTPDAVKDEALRRESAFLNHEPLNSGDTRKADQRAADIMSRSIPSADEGGSLQANPELTRDVVKPRVVHLCRQASSQLRPEDRKPANLLLEEFIAVEDSLSMDDLEYIVANVAYKTVRNWAGDRQAKLNDDLAPSPRSDGIETSDAI